MTLVKRSVFAMNTDDDVFNASVKKIGITVKQAKDAARDYDCSAYHVDGHSHCPFCGFDGEPPSGTVRVKDGAASGAPGARKGETFK